MVLRGSDCSDVGIRSTNSCWSLTVNWWVTKKGKKSQKFCLIRIMVGYADWEEGDITPALHLDSSLLWTLAFMFYVLGVWLTTVGLPPCWGSVFNLHFFEVSPTFSSSLSSSCLQHSAYFPLLLFFLHNLTFASFTPLLLPVRLLPAIPFLPAPTAAHLVQLVHVCSANSCITMTTLLSLCELAWEQRPVSRRLKEKCT